MFNSIKSLHDLKFVLDFYPNLGSRVRTMLSAAIYQPLKWNAGTYQSKRPCKNIKEGKVFILISISNTKESFAHAQEIHKNKTFTSIMPRDQWRVQNLEVWILGQILSRQTLLSLWDLTASLLGVIRLQALYTLSHWQQNKHWQLDSSSIGKPVPLLIYLFFETVRNWKCGLHFGHMSSKSYITFIFTAMFSPDNELQKHSSVWYSNVEHKHFNQCLTARLNTQSIFSILFETQIWNFYTFPNELK